MPGTGTRLADYMPYRLAVTSNEVSGHIAGAYRKRFGLKIPEWRVMNILGDGGSQTQRDLGRLAVMDKVAVNRACKVLEERGLIARTPNAADGRSHHLELTAAGREMFDQIWPHSLAIGAQIFSCLSEAETEKLRKILGKLLDSVRKLEGDSK
jgi:DNA-binding MarR family transcriptional regulator